MTVDKALVQDRELREHATARPWHQDGHGSRLRLVGPLPRSTVVVDPYAPNPQDAPLLLHRVNTYEELEAEIERLRAWLRDVRARLAAHMRRIRTSSLLPATCERVSARLLGTFGQTQGRRPPYALRVGDRRHLIEIP
jgi:hypothetical protein